MYRKTNPGRCSSQSGILTRDLRISSSALKQSATLPTTIIVVLVGIIILASVLFSIIDWILTCKQAWDDL